MRRIALAVAAHLFVASPALATGAFVTKAAGFLAGGQPTQYYDMSGVGLGPFLPAVVATDGAGGINSGSGGGVISFSRIPSPSATTNATLAKPSAGRVYKVVACNTTTADYFIHFTNQATIPAPGATAVLFSRPIPRAGAANGLACVSYDLSNIGWYFSAGIGYWLSAGGSDADATALMAGQGVQISVEYQ